MVVHGTVTYPNEVGALWWSKRDDGGG